MQSKIAESVKLKYQPVALLWSSEKPGDAKEFAPKKWGCVMWHLASAAKGKTAAIGAETYGCWGGGVGMGFGNIYETWPGGIEVFYHFLSIGNQKWEHGRQVCEQIKPYLREESYENFLHGERYIKTPDLVKNFVQDLPITQIPEPYVVLKPLSGLAAGETPVSVTFIADSDQLSALVILANYFRPGNENVIIPYAAGCQTLGIYPYKEASSENPRAVIGLTDLSARQSLRPMLGENFLTFTAPWKLFQEMENHVEGSFLQMHTWKSLAETK